MIKDTDGIIEKKKCLENEITKLITDFEKETEWDASVLEFYKDFNYNSKKFFNKVTVGIYRGELSIK